MSGLKKTTYFYLRHADSLFRSRLLPEGDCVVLEHVQAESPRTGVHVCFEVCVSEEDGFFVNTRREGEVDQVSCFGSVLAALRYVRDAFSGLNGICWLECVDELGDQAPTMVNGMLHNPEKIRRDMLPVPGSQLKISFTLDDLQLWELTDEALRRRQESLSCWDDAEDAGWMEFMATA